MTTAVLETLVGEGKKYQTPEQLAEAKLEADRHIDNLNAQLQALKDQVSSGSSVSASAIEAILAEIKQSKTGGQPANTSSEPANNQGVKTLTEAEIVKIVERQHEQTRQATVRAQTLDQVNRVYGSKSEEFLTNLAGQTGFTVDQLKTLAGTQPAAFLRLANLGQPRNAPQGSPSSSVNTQALTVNSNSDGTVRNKAYYEAKMKEMGSRKFAFDSAMQIQMHRDMASLGDAWDNTM